MSDRPIEARCCSVVLIVFLLRLGEAQPSQPGSLPSNHPQMRAHLDRALLLSGAPREGGVSPSPGRTCLGSRGKSTRAKGAPSSCSGLVLVDMAPAILGSVAQAKEEEVIIIPHVHFASSGNDGIIIRRVLGNVLCSLRPCI
jgi:hypothetical protein